MKLLLFIGSLKVGGAEKQLSCLARYLQNQSNDFLLVVMYSGGRHWDQMCDSEIPIKALFRQKQYSKFAKLMHLLVVPFLLANIMRRHCITHAYSMLEVSNFL